MNMYDEFVRDKLIITGYEGDVIDKLVLLDLFEDWCNDKGYTCLYPHKILFHLENKLYVTYIPKEENGLHILVPIYNRISIREEGKVYDSVRLCSTMSRYYLMINIV